MATVRPYVSKRKRKNEVKQDVSDPMNPSVVAAATKQDFPSADSNFERPFPHHQASTFPKRICKANRTLPNACRKIFSSHDNAVNCVRWNTDAHDSVLLSASMDSKVLLFRYSDGAPALLESLDIHNRAVKDARWSNDNRFILSGGYDKHARISDAHTGQEIFSHSFKEFVTSVLYHPSKPEVFLSGTCSKGIFAIDANSGKEIHHYKSFFGQVQDLLFHPDEKTFFSTAEILKRNSMDKAILAWDFDTAAMMSNQISQEAFGCSCLQLHSNDPVFLAQYGTGYISIFSTDPPYRLNKYKRFEGHQTAGYNIGFSISPDGSCVASGDREGDIHIYDFSSSRLLRKLNAYGSACMDVAYHPFNANVIASCSWGGEVSFWG